MECYTEGRRAFTWADKAVNFKKCGSRETVYTKNEILIDQTQESDIVIEDKGFPLFIGSSYENEFIYQAKITNATSDTNRERYNNETYVAAYSNSTKISRKLSCIVY